MNQSGQRDSFRYHRFKSLYHLIQLLKHVLFLEQIEQLHRFKFIVIDMIFQFLEPLDAF